MMEYINIAIVCLLTIIAIVIIVYIKKEEEREIETMEQELNICINKVLTLACDATADKYRKKKLYSKSDIQEIISLLQTVDKLLTAFYSDE